MTTQTAILLLFIFAVICGVRFLEKKLFGKPKESAGKPSEEPRPSERSGRTAAGPTQPR
jgi:hypothetical protein